MGRLQTHRKRTIEDVYHDTIAPDADGDRRVTFEEWVTAGCPPWLDLAPGDHLVISAHLAEVAVTA